MKAMFVIQRFTSGGDDGFIEDGRRPMSRNETLKLEDWSDVVRTMRMAVSNAKINFGPPPQLPLVFKDSDDIVLVYMELSVED